MNRPSGIKEGGELMLTTKQPASQSKQKRGSFRSWKLALQTPPAKDSLFLSPSLSAVDL